MWHFTFFQRFSSTVPREQPGPARSFNSARGLHWFPLPLKLFQRFSREGHTRSHSEHGSQASLRRWYLAPGPGRVGRRWIHAPLAVNGERGFFYALNSILLFPSSESSMNVIDGHCGHCCHLAVFGSIVCPGQFFIAFRTTLSVLAAVFEVYLPIYNIH